MMFDDVEAGELEAMPTSELLVSDDPVAARSRATRRARGTVADGSDEIVPLAWGPIPEDAPLDRRGAERELLAAIGAGLDAARAVYSDWLEEHGEFARATYLRIEQLVRRLDPSDPRFEGCRRQLREVAPFIGADWRARVARLPVEGCARERGCTGRWELLERTERETVRYCGTCRRHVHYFGSVDEARAAARHGHSVAIDLGAERWQDDLRDPGVRCGCCARRVLSTARFCPHCGDALHGGLVVAGLFAADHGE